jgi:hypothetical protein
MLSACDNRSQIDCLGQSPPGRIPAIFAPGIVSTELDEFGCTMSPDGHEFYFTRTYIDPPRHSIMACRLNSAGWTQPEIANFSGQYSDAEPIFSPDGTRLFFSRLHDTGQNQIVSEIHVLKRLGENWQEPKYITTGMFASISNKNILFFTDISNGIQKAEIVKSEYLNDEFSHPELLNSGINSPYQDAHPFIDPDERYIIFDSDRPGGYGNNDLYVCFRETDGTWGDAINLGEQINTPGYDAIPSVSPDCKYLFFCRMGDIYWVDTKIIEILRIKER